MQGSLLQAHHVPRARPAHTSQPCHRVATDVARIVRTLTSQHHRQQLSCVSRGSLQRCRVIADTEDVEQEPPADAQQRRRGRPKKDVRDTAPEVVERGAPRVPYPGVYQQTLVRSFTLGGIGLHSGDYAVLRVRPAFAGEGRYFVRVPEGTNKDRFELEEDELVDPETLEQAPLDPELETKKMQLFQQYLMAQEEGFDGGFDDFLYTLDATDIITKIRQGLDERDEWDVDNPEPIQGLSEEDIVVQAGSAQLAGFQFQTLSMSHPSIVEVINSQTPEALEGLLEQGAFTVVGPELLLAALECCGVENARIEIEGGLEVPVLDGSALGWAMEIQFAGVRPAPAKDGSEELTVRLRPQLSEPVSVQQEDGHITFVPQDMPRVSAGINVQEVCQIMGKQWHSWCMYEDLPFRLEVAPARRYLAHPAHVQELISLGMLRGGAESVMLVGAEDRYWDPDLLRFTYDEGARHEVCVLLGCLSTLARPGHTGHPQGHVIAYKPTMELHRSFLEAMQAKLTDESWVPAWISSENGEQQGEQQEQQGQQGEGEDEYYEGEDEGEAYQAADEYQDGEGDEGAAEEEQQEAGEAEASDQTVDVELDDDSSSADEAEGGKPKGRPRR